MTGPGRRLRDRRCGSPPSRGWARLQRKKRAQEPPSGPLDPLGRGGGGLGVPWVPGLQSQPARSPCPGLSPPPQACRGPDLGSVRWDFGLHTPCPSPRPAPTLLVERGLPTPWAQRCECGGRHSCPLLRWQSAGPAARPLTAPPGQTSPLRPVRARGWSPCRARFCRDQRALRWPHGAQRTPQGCRRAAPGPAEHRGSVSAARAV